MPLSWALLHSATVFSLPLPNVASSTPNAPLSAHLFFKPTCRAPFIRSGPRTACLSTTRTSTPFLWKTGGGGCSARAGHTSASFSPQLFLSPAIANPVFTDPVLSSFTRQLQRHVRQRRSRGQRQPHGHCSWRPHWHHQQAKQRAQLHLP